MKQIRCAVVASYYGPYYSNFVASLYAFNEMMIGMLTENYVASCFKFNDLNLNYWKNDYERLMNL